jgi:hypothetical protein
MEEGNGSHYVYRGEKFTTNRITVNTILAILSQVSRAAQITRHFMNECEKFCVDEAVT